MKCGECKFWVLQKQCRVRSPVVMRIETPESQKRTHYQENTHLVTRWPETLSSEWCGEFESKVLGE